MTIFVLCTLLVQRTFAQQTDADRLGMAIEYFQGGKYHEALLLFERLDQAYQLNPRFRAYMGVCYYYEWSYEQACQYLDATIPLLGEFSPHERSVYYYSDAESHFNLKEYDKSIPLYEEFLNVCYDNEKPEALFHLGFCYIFLNDYHNARDYFESSLAYYQRFRNTADQQPRIQQIQNMILGCNDSLRQDSLPTLPSDTISSEKQKNDL